MSEFPSDSRDAYTSTSINAARWGAARQRLAETLEQKARSGDGEAAIGLVVVEAMTGFMNDNYGQIQISNNLSEGDISWQ